MMYLNGSVIGAGTEQRPKVALFTLSKARDKGLSEVIFLMDAREVVLALIGDEDLEISPIVMDIKTIASNFEYINFVHIPREINAAA